MTHFPICHSFPDKLYFHYVYSRKEIKKEELYLEENPPIYDCRVLEEMSKKTHI